MNSVCPASQQLVVMCSRHPRSFFGFGRRLTGAQPKTGFYNDPKGNRWVVPSGVIPRTHIFKPTTGSFDGYVENQHFCIGLARGLEMPVAPSVIQYFDAAAVIVVERYDRVRNGAKVTRIHQKDMCRALARMTGNFIRG